jgi:hypothetical protein
MDVTIYRHGQRLSVEPELPEVTGVLRTTQRYYDAAQGRVRSRTELLLPDLTMRPNGGLAWPLMRLLMRHGHQPTITTFDGPRVRPVQQADSSLEDDFATFLRSNEHGLIAHAGGLVGIAKILERICAAFPAAGIYVASANRSRIRKMGRLLQPLARIINVMRTDALPRRIRRVTIGTFTDAVNTESQFWRSDFVFLLHAPEALHQRAAQALMAVDTRFRLFGFLPLDQRLSTHEADWMMATFGAERFEIPGDGIRYRAASVAWLRVGGRPVANSADNFRLHRDGYWLCNARNHRIAQAAKAIVAGDERGILGYLSQDAFDHLSLLHGRRTMIVAANVTQACQLARYLPRWRIITAPDTVTDSLSAEEQRLVAERRPGWDGGDGLIVTEAALGPVAVLQPDVLFWAIGGRHGATVLRDALICEAGESDPVLVVDCNDRDVIQHRNWCRKRKLAYIQAGWFEPGIDPFVGRTREFVEAKDRAAT